MTKKYATKQFNQFLPMIEKACWHYSKKYKIDHSEIEGQGYLIFCEALKTFDKSKACFSTHLTNELQRLEGYCKKEFRKNNKDVQRIKTNGRGYGRNIYRHRLSFYGNETRQDNQGTGDNPLETSGNYYKIKLNERLAYNYDIFDKVITKMDYEISLSQDAKEIVEYICSRDWEILDDNWKPRFSFIQKKYLSKGWTRNRIVKAWENISRWWQGSNKDQFCLEV
jgi:hypothetical protein